MNTRGLLTATFLVALLPGQALAGAWPHGDGQVMLSFRGDSVLEGPSRESNFVIYADYGLSPASTPGGEFFVPPDRTANLTGYVEISRRVAMISENDPLAHSARIAVQDPGSGTAISVSPGIHLGHGFTTPLGNGWATLDGWLHLPNDGAGRVTEFEAQIGTRISVNWTLMLGAGRYATDTYDGTRITPSVAFGIGYGRTFQFSYTEELGDTPVTSLEASLWMAF